MGFHLTPNTSTGCGASELTAASTGASCSPFAPRHLQEHCPGEKVAVDSEVVEVRSEFSDTFAAANAIDGDPAIEWSSAGDGDDAYLIIDLRRTTDVIAVGFHTRSMSNGTATTDAFTVTVDDAEVYGPFPMGRIEVAFSGRVVRFDGGTSTGGTPVRSGERVRVSRSHPKHAGEEGGKYRQRDEPRSHGCEYPPAPSLDGRSVCADPFHCLRFGASHYCGGGEEQADQDDGGGEKGG